MTTDWKSVADAPKDRRVMVWVANGGRAEFARWNDERFFKNPCPFWDWSDLRGKAFMKANQPAWWAEVPEGPMTGEVSK